MVSVAKLIENERSQLEQMLGTTALEFADRDAGHCSVKTDEITVHFHCSTEGEIHSSIELISVPTHALEFTNHLHTWLVLKSRGEDWPKQRKEDPQCDQLKQELRRLQDAISIVRDKTSLREALFWEAGYMDGYSWRE